jgi:hypothetical protein
MTTAFQSNAFQNSGFQVDPVTGVLYVVDENDSGSFVGQVGISGVLSVTDQDDSCNIQGTVAQPNQMDMHDGFTPDEIKRARALDKKIAKLEAKKRQAILDKRLKRKQALRDLVFPPVVKEQQTEVELHSEAQRGIPPLDLKKVNANLIRLEQQKKQLLKAVELRMQIAQKQMQLAIFEAQKKAAEQDEEDTILALLL